MVDFKTEEEEGRGEGKARRRRRKVMRIMLGKICATDKDPSARAKQIPETPKTRQASEEYQK